MLLSKLRVWRSHGRQFIPDLDAVRLPSGFRGRPEVTGEFTTAEAETLAGLCPSGAIAADPFTLDLGRCVFCKECALRYPDKLRFTTDFRMATNDRERLLIRAGSPDRIGMDAGRVRRELVRLFGRALRLREVCAGGDASTEMELNASMNVNFDFGRYGIEFVASPRHADGIVITGPITENMAVPLEICYNAVASPKLVVLAGSDAISGGVFAGGPALDRGFLDRFGVDLFVPGNPVHPLTFIHGVLDLLGRKHNR